MSCLPPWVAATVAPFAPLFSRRVWAHAQVLLVGALLAPHSAPSRWPYARPGVPTRPNSTATIGCLSTRAGRD